MSVNTITFNVSGYNLTGSTLNLESAGTTAPTAAIQVAANVTAEIDSAFADSAGTADISVGNGGTLTLTNGGGGGTLDLGSSTATTGVINLNGGTFGGSILNMGGNSIVQGASTVTMGTMQTGLLAAGSYTMNSSSAVLTDSGNLNISRGSVSTFTEQLGTATIAGPVSVGYNNTGTLSVTGGSFTLTGTVASGKGVLVINAGGITGTENGTVNLSGTGTLTAPEIAFGGAASAYAAGTKATLNVTGGTLYVGSGGIFLGANAPGTNTINLSGGTVGATASWASSMNMTLGTTNGNITFQTGNSSASPFNIGLSGALSGAGGLNVTGTGTLALSGGNSYTGATTVSSGALSVQSNGALGTASGQTSGVTVSSGAALQIQGGITTTEAVGLTLNGTGLAANPKGALENVSGTNTYTGLIALGSAATIGSDSGTLNLTNPGTITGSGLGLTLAGAGNGNISSIIGTGAGSVTMSGAGTWTLSGANTYSGGTTLSSGSGVLQLSGAGTLGSSGSAVTLHGGTLDLGGTTQAVGAVLITGSGANATIQNGSTTFTSLSDTATSSADSVNVSLTGSGSVTLSGVGTTLTLGNANTYNGVTTINGGTLAAGAANVFSANSEVSLANASGAVLLLNGFSNSIGSLTGGGSLGGNVNLGSATLTVGNDNTSPGAYAGVISGTGGHLNEVGTGTLTLSGSNTYSGGTTVNAGASLLVKNTAGSATGTGNLNVVRGATLAGSGIVNATAGAINLGQTGSGKTQVYVGQNDSGDTGTSANLMLKAASGLNVANATLTFNLNSASAGGSGTPSAVDGTGTSGSGNELVVGNTAVTFGTGDMLQLNLQGSLAVSNYTPYILFAGTSATIIGGGGATSGQYAGLSITTETINGTTYDVITGGLTYSGLGSYGTSFLYLNQNGGYDDIEVMVVPEPGTWALMLGGLAMLIFWLRRKNKSEVNCRTRHRREG